MKRYLYFIEATFLSLALLGSATAQTPKVEDPMDLATIHEEIGKVDCKDCHKVNNPKTIPPETALRQVNQQCMACHGTMANVAAKIRPMLSNKHINPHDSHVVSIECVTCHTAHKPQKSYCINCHAFDMPMPVGKRYTAK